MNFSATSCKKCLISWKNTKTHRFGQNSQLFEQTTMFRRFHEIFSRKLQKVPHFVKKHENHRFGQNSQLFEHTTMFRRLHKFFRKNLQKVPHFVKKHEKSSIWPKLSTFRTNYHVSAFAWNFQQKLAKVPLVMRTPSKTTFPFIPCIRTTDRTLRIFFTNRYLTKDLMQIFGN